MGSGCFCLVRLPQLLLLLDRPLLTVPRCGFDQSPPWLLSSLTLPTDSTPFLLSSTARVSGLRISELRIAAASFPVFLTVANTGITPTCRCRLDRRCRPGSPLAFLSRAHAGSRVLGFKGLGVREADEEEEQGDRQGSSRGVGRRKTMKDPSKIPPFMLG